ncbi:MAG: hypothetical protein OQK32_08510 [Gammaproteobacteria bacterium]|nr:hypothetical protein [Gammaproteobacteria bacterium]MCW8923840.1 hypothetical protein [Gammaproteobacteria bacterium]
MKKLFLFFALVAALLIVYPFFNKSENMDVVTGLPWQIDVLPDGSSQVFGLHLGVSRLADVLGILGEDDVELAIIAASDELGSLEVYYGHFLAGVISGKLIIMTDASEHNIKRWRENAIKSEHTATGRAKKYILSVDDLKLALHEVVTGLTFIPSLNLDEEIILARFGEPAERVQLDGAMHYLYPDKGLDIALFEEAKEVIQYVAPGSFQSITSQGK